MGTSQPSLRRVVGGIYNSRKPSTHLGFGHHLEPDQEFPHAAAPQQGRVKVDVEVRRVVIRGLLRLTLSERGQGRLMDTHRIGEWGANIGNGMKIQLREFDEGRLYGL